MEASRILASSRVNNASGVAHRSREPASTKNRLAAEPLAQPQRRLLHALATPPAWLIIVPASRPLRTTGQLSSLWRRVNYTTPLAWLNALATLWQRSGNALATLWQRLERRLCRGSSLPRAGLYEESARARPVLDASGRHWQKRPRQHCYVLLAVRYRASGAGRDKGASAAVRWGPRLWRRGQRHRVAVAVPLQHTTHLP